MSSVQDTTRSRRGVRRPKRVSIDHAAGSEILRLDAAHPAQQTNAFVVLAPYFDIKPMVDRAITAGLMLVALPIMAVVGLSVLALDGRPVFYRQKRVGKNGRLFRIWKFRTMRPDAESRTGAVWSCQADPRVTKLGQWLRSSHLDELPQLFNVLAGDMNLIGPRPERPEFVSELEQQLACYSQRIKVAPGITGLAQIRTGYDHCVADVSRKVDIDLEYLRGASFWSDMKLLADTGLYILRHLWDTRMRVNRETAARKLTDKHAAEEAAYVGPSSLVGVGVGQAVRRSVPFTGTAVAADGESSAIERLTQLVHEIEECS